MKAKERWLEIVVLPILILCMCTGLPIFGRILFWCGLGGVWFLVWRDFDPSINVRQSDVRPETMYTIMGLNLMSWIAAFVIWIMIILM